VPPPDEASRRAHLAAKQRDEYRCALALPDRLEPRSSVKALAPGAAVAASASASAPRPAGVAPASIAATAAARERRDASTTDAAARRAPAMDSADHILDTQPEPADVRRRRADGTALALVRARDVAAACPSIHTDEDDRDASAAARPVSSAALARRLPSQWPRPRWHAPWRCYRVISGHLGWVRSVAFDPSNEWFCTGSGDRTIKVWDTASGQLKLTLTGHIEQVTGLAVSDRHPYLFSVGLDKARGGRAERKTRGVPFCPPRLSRPPSPLVDDPTSARSDPSQLAFLRPLLPQTVKCWDLEYNKVIRSYHGHLSGVYSVALHPTLDVLFTGGRDSTCRMWDMRTKLQVHCLTGHDGSVGSVIAAPTDPQCITGSQDTTVRLWDVRTGKTLHTLTHHKKGVRALAAGPRERTFVSGAADNVKKFGLPDGRFLHNFLQRPGRDGSGAVVNALAVNDDGVCAVGCDGGALSFVDWHSGNTFQAAETVAQPGSVEGAENGIFAAAFDTTGGRLVTGEADKTVKMWREDANATEQSHPVRFDPQDVAKQLRRAR